MQTEGRGRMTLLHIIHVLDKAQKAQQLGDSYGRGRLLCYLKDVVEDFEGPIPKEMLAVLLNEYLPLRRDPLYGPLVKALENRLAREG